MDQGLLTTRSRRSAQRICTRTDVGILDEASGERLLGQLRDLSNSGVCLATKAALPIGKQVRIAFEFDSGKEPVRIQAEVIWSGRAEGRRGGVLSGLRFLHLRGPDLARLRAFLEERLWAVQRFLCMLELFADMNDIEKRLVASIAYDRELEAGKTLDDTACENALIVVRAGTLKCEEATEDGRAAPARTLTAGDVCGALPIDPRGGSLLKLRASTDASVLCIPGEGFWYLSTTHAGTALKLLSSWCLTLRDRLFAVEPRR